MVESLNTIESIGTQTNSHDDAIIGDTKLDDDDELSVIDYKLIDSNKLEKDAHIKHEVLTGLDEITSG